MWAIVKDTEKWGTCLERLVYGTREYAEEIAAEMGSEYRVEDGTATADAFDGDNT